MLAMPPGRAHRREPTLPFRDRVHTERSGLRDLESARAFLCTARGHCYLSGVTAPSESAANAVPQATAKAPQDAAASAPKKTSQPRGATKSVATGKSSARGAASPASKATEQDARGKVAAVKRATSTARTAKSAAGKKQSAASSVKTAAVKQATRTAAGTTAAAKQSTAKAAATKTAAAKAAASAANEPVSATAPKKPAAKSTARKKPAAKSTAAKSTAAKSTAAKKPAAKSTTAKNAKSATATKQATAKKPAASATKTAANTSAAEAASATTAPKTSGGESSTPARTSARKAPTKKAPAAPRKKTPAASVAAKGSAADEDASSTTSADSDDTIEQPGSKQPDAVPEGRSPIAAHGAPRGDVAIAPATTEPESASESATSDEPRPADDANRHDEGDDADVVANVAAESTEVTALPAAVPAEALVIRGLVKSFGDSRAVDGIDLTVPSGSFYGLVGPNGAGKTTTLSVIAGLLRPDAGTVVVSGIDQGVDALAAKKVTGVLPDRLRTFDRLTGRQLLHYYGQMRGLERSVIEKRTADLARAFDLGEALGRVVSDYSAGMTKKIMLAGAMIHSPRVLVLDEPFEAVDPVSSGVILDILRAYVDHGGTVILSSHGLDLVERVCSKIAIIVGGDVLAEGTIDEVRAGQTLASRFVELSGGGAEVEGLEWLHTFSA